MTEKTNKIDKEKNEKFWKETGRKLAQESKSGKAKKTKSTKSKKTNKKDNQEAEIVAVEEPKTEQVIEPIQEAVEEKEVAKETVQEEITLEIKDDKHEEPTPEHQQLTEDVKNIVAEITTSKKTPNGIKKTIAPQKKTYNRFSNYWSGLSNVEY